MRSPMPAARCWNARASILAEVANIRSIAANLRHEARGELRIATTHTQARFALPGAIAALSRSYPEVSVHLQPAARHRDARPARERRGRHGRGQHAPVRRRPAASRCPPIAGSGGCWCPRTIRWPRCGRAPTLEELAAQPLVSYDSSLKPESSLRRAFEAAGLQPQIAMTASDADLIKTYVRAGLGVGVLAEMALLPADSADLRALPADHLFASCTTWIVLRRDSVLRDYMLEFIASFAPHLDRRAVGRLVSHGRSRGLAGRAAVARAAAHVAAKAVHGAGLSRRQRRRRDAGATQGARRNGCAASSSWRSCWRRRTRRNTARGASDQPWLPAALTTVRADPGTRDAMPGLSAPPPPCRSPAAARQSEARACSSPTHTASCRPHSRCRPKKRVSSAAMPGSSGRVVWVSPIDT